MMSQQHFPNSPAQPPPANLATDQQFNAISALSVEETFRINQRLVAELDSKSQEINTLKSTVEFLQTENNVQKNKVTGLSRDLKQLQLYSMAQVNNRDFVVKERDKLIKEKIKWRGDVEKYCEMGQELERNHLELNNTFNAVVHEKNIVIEDRNRLGEKASGLEHQVNSLTGELKKEKESKIKLEEQVRNAMSQNENLSEDLTKQKNFHRAEKVKLRNAHKDELKELQEMFYFKTEEAKIKLNGEKAALSENVKVMEAKLKELEDEKSDIKRAHEHETLEQKEHHAKEVEKHEKNIESSARLIAKLKEGIGKVKNKVSDLVTTQELRENDLQGEIKVLKENFKLQQDAEAKKAKGLEVDNEKQAQTILELESTLKQKELNIISLIKSEKESQSAAKHAEEKFVELGKQKGVEIASLKKLVDDKNAAARKIQEKFATLVKQTKAEKDALKKLVDVKEAKVKANEKKITQLQAEIHSLKNILNEKNAEMKIKGDEVLQQGDVIQQQSERMKTLNTKLAVSEDEKRVKEEQLRQQSESLNSCLDEITKMGKQLANVMKDIDVKEKVISKLSSEISEKKGKMSQDNATWKNQVDSLTKENLQLGSLIKTKEDKIRELGANQEVSDKNIHELQKSLDSMKLERDQLVETNSTNEAVIKRLQECIDLVHQEKEKLGEEKDAEITQLRESKTSFEVAKQQMEAQVIKLGRQIEEELCEGEKTEFPKLALSGYETESSKLVDLLKEKAEELKQKCEALQINEQCLNNKVKMKEEKSREQRQKLENLQNGVIRRESQLQELRENLAGLELENNGIHAILLTVQRLERVEYSKLNEFEKPFRKEAPGSSSPTKFKPGHLFSPKKTMKRKMKPPRNSNQPSTSSTVMMIDLTLDDSIVVKEEWVSPPSKTSKKNSD